MKTRHGLLSVEEGLIGSGPVMGLKQGRRRIDIYSVEEAQWIKRELNRFIKAHKDRSNKRKKSK
jgi:hypothetical protein